MIALQPTQAMAFSETFNSSLFSDQTVIAKPVKGKRTDLLKKKPSNPGWISLLYMESFIDHR